jgi:hypothetical protein
MAAPGSVGAMVFSATAFRRYSAAAVMLRRVLSRSPASSARLAVRPSGERWGSVKVAASPRAYWRPLARLSAVSVAPLSSFANRRTVVV